MECPTITAGSFDAPISGSSACRKRRTRTRSAPGEGKRSVVLRICSPFLAVVSRETKRTTKPFLRFPYVVGLGTPISFNYVQPKGGVKCLVEKKPWGSRLKGKTCGNCRRAILGCFRNLRSPAKSLTFSGLVENPLVGKKLFSPNARQNAPNNLQGGTFAILSPIPKREENSCMFEMFKKRLEQRGAGLHPKRYAIRGGTHVCKGGYKKAG